MSAPQIQSSFNAGEISPELYGAVDLKKISAAGTTIRNMTCNYRGGVISRGGLAFVGRCKQAPPAAPSRPIPFQFSITQGYTLEFGDNYLRFVFQGGYVLENPVPITNALQANPVLIDVIGQPFMNGDWVFANGVQGMTQLNGNTYIVANSMPGSFTLNDLNGNPVNGVAYGAYMGGGTFARIYTVTTPYAAVDLPYLKFAQTADVMSLTCSNPTTLTEYPQYDLTRLSAIDWTLTAVNFGPAIIAPAGVTALANAQAPTTGINATFSYVVTSVDGQGNESIASAQASCHGANIQVEGGTNTVSWTYVQGAAFYNIYRSPPSVDNGMTPILVPAGSLYGFVGSSYGTQFADNQSVVDLTQTPPTHGNPFAQGQILAVDILDPGTSVGATNYAITTAMGSGFSGTPVLNNGNITAFPITNNGFGYREGDSIAFNGAGHASGAISFATNPNPGDTITLNGVVWTFVYGTPAAQQTTIAGALSVTLASLVNDLTNSGIAAVVVATYASDITKKILLVTYKQAGTGGNSYTLAASAATPSGAFLMGGSGSTGGVATGSYTFTVQPTVGQAIILNGQNISFGDFLTVPFFNNVLIGSSLAHTLNNLAFYLNSSTSINLNVATYAISGGTVLNITYKTTGSVGDTYTLLSGSYGGTTSGPTLTGGTNSTGNPSAILVVGPNSGTYPGVVTYFQQRRFYANSLNNPDTFWASQTELFSNFDTSVPTIATDAITASPWTEQVNGIQWLIPMPGGLIAMTGRRAWQILGEGSYSLNAQPITPSTTQAQAQAFNGASATIPPVVIDYDVVYVEAVSNSIVRDLSWTVFTNIYTGNDLTILSSHLFLNYQLVQGAWARNPYKILWLTRNDGTMLSLTYLKEQEVYGWARHDTQGLVVGIAAITEPPVDAVYCIVQRFPPYAPQGIYCMERMDNRLWQAVEDGYCVDSGIANPMSSPATYLYASASTGAVQFTAGLGVFSPPSVGQIIRMGGGIATVQAYTSPTVVSGTWNLGASNGAIGLPFASAGTWNIATPVTTLNASHLAGMSVVGLADGVPIGPLAVGATGLVNLPFAASNVKIGLPFVAQVQTPYLNGGDPTVQGRRKVVPAATARLASSAAFQIGTNQPDGAAQNPPNLGITWTGLAQVNLLSATGGQSPPKTYTSPGGQTVTPLWTGDYRQVGAGAEWNSKGQIAIQQTLPMALEIVAIIPEILDGDTPEVALSPRQAGQQPQGPGRHMLRI